MVLERTNEWDELQSIVVKNRQPIERVKPVVRGDVAPFFSMIDTSDYWQASIFTAGLPGQTITLTELLMHGPVVVGFYCPCWGSYAQPFLSALARLSAEVRLAGGQLVVFTNQSPKYILPHPDLSEMLMVYDAGNAVARRFGVYSENDPIWDRVSGISEDVYIPALYVIDRSRQIRYHFVDENFEGLATHAADVLNAL